MSGLSQEDIKVLTFYADRDNRELYWNYLAKKPGNDGYGELALGVVRNDNMPGAVANAFADAEAKRAGVHLSERGWNTFGVDLMERDLKLRATYVERGRGNLALNLPAKDVMQAHDDAFTNVKIPVKAWTPREYLQAAHREGEREAGPRATPAQREAGGTREMESAWTGMLNNVHLGVDRGAKTIVGTSYQYNDEQLGAAGYTARMGLAYAAAAVSRPNTDPDLIGASTVYHQRGRDGRWSLVSEGPEYGPAFMSPSEMRSESPERNPQRLRELEDTRQLRLEVKDRRDDFHPLDTNHSIKRSPRTLAESEPLGDGVRVAAAAPELNQRRPEPLQDAPPAAAREQHARALPERALPEAVLLDNALHPNHNMYASLLNVVHARDDQAARGRDQISVEVAGGLTEKARERNLSKIGFAQFSDDGTKVSMTDTQDPTAPWAKTAVGRVGDVVGQSLDKSSDNVAKINQQLAMVQGVTVPPLSQANPDVPEPKGPRLV